MPCPKCGLDVRETQPGWYDTNSRCPYCGYQVIKREYGPGVNSAGLVELFGCLGFLAIVAILVTLVYFIIAYPAHRLTNIVGAIGVFLTIPFLYRLCFGPKYVKSIFGPTERNKTIDWAGVILVPS